MKVLSRQGRDPQPYTATDQNGFSVVKWKHLAALLPTFENVRLLLQATAISSVYQEEYVFWMTCSSPPRSRCPKGWKHFSNVWNSRSCLGLDGFVISWQGCFCRTYKCVCLLKWADSFLDRNIDWYKFGVGRRNFLHYFLFLRFLPCLSVLLLRTVSCLILRWRTC